MSDGDESALVGIVVALLMAAAIFAWVTDAEGQQQISVREHTNSAERGLHRSRAEPMVPTTPTTADEAPLAGEPTPLGSRVAGADLLTAIVADGDDDDDDEREWPAAEAERGRDHQKHGWYGAEIRGQGVWRQHATSGRRPVEVGRGRRGDRSRRVPRRGRVGDDERRRIRHGIAAGDAAVQEQQGGVGVEDRSGHLRARRLRTAFRGARRGPSHANERVLRGKAQPEGWRVLGPAPRRVPELVTSGGVRERLRAGQLEHRLSIISWLEERGNDTFTLVLGHIGLKRVARLPYWQGRHWIDALTQYSRINKRRHPRGRRIRALPWGCTTLLEPPGRAWSILAESNRQWAAVTAMAARVVAGETQDPCPQAIGYNGPSDRTRGRMVRVCRWLPIANRLWRRAK